MTAIMVRPAVDAKERKMCDDIVVQYHSYVASSRTVGRALKYLIYADDELAGTFWLGSGFKPTPKAILTHFGVSQKDFDKMFNTVADNKRFCLIKHIPNLGSQVLSIIRGRAKTDWFNAYGDNLVGIVTTIGDGKKGSVYLADNWIKIGHTAGLPPNRKSVSMKWDEKETINQRFVKPTGENKKTILVTTKLQNTIYSDLAVL